MELSNEKIDKILKEFRESNMAQSIFSLSLPRMNDFLSDTKKKTQILLKSDVEGEECSKTKKPISVNENIYLSGQLNSNNNQKLFDQLLEGEMNFISNKNPRIIEKNKSLSSKLALLNNFSKTEKREINKKEEAMLSESEQSDEESESEGSLSDFPMEARFKDLSNLNLNTFTAPDPPKNIEKEAGGNLKRKIREYIDKQKPEASEEELEIEGSEEDIDEDFGMEHTPITEETESAEEGSQILIDDPGLKLPRYPLSKNSRFTKLNSGGKENLPRKVLNRQHTPPGGLGLNKPPNPLKVARPQTAKVVYPPKTSNYNIQEMGLSRPIHPTGKISMKVQNPNRLLDRRSFIKLKKPLITKGKGKKNDPVARFQKMQNTWSKSKFLKQGGCTGKEGRKLHLDKFYWGHKTDNQVPEKKGNVLRLLEEQANANFPIENRRDDLRFKLRGQLQREGFGSEEMEDFYYCRPQTAGAERDQDVRASMKNIKKMMLMIQNQTEQYKIRQSI